MLNIVFKKRGKCYRFYEVGNGNIWVTRTDKNGDVWLVEILCFDGNVQSQKQFVLNHAKKYKFVEEDIVFLYPKQKVF